MFSSSSDEQPSSSDDNENADSSDSYDEGDDETHHASLLDGSTSQTAPHSKIDERPVVNVHGVPGLNLLPLRGNRSTVEQSIDDAPYETPDSNNPSADFATTGMLAGSLALGCISLTLGTAIEIAPKSRPRRRTQTERRAKIAHFFGSYPPEDNESSEECYSDSGTSLPLADGEEEVED